MTVDYTTDPGGLGPRLGRIIKGIDSANLFLGGSDISAGGLRAVGVLADRIFAQFLASDEHIVNDLYSSLRDDVRTVLDSYKAGLRDMAEATLIEMVDDDVTLSVENLETAMLELYNQMVNNAGGSPSSPDESVDANTMTLAGTTVTETTAAAQNATASTVPIANTGDTAIVVSGLRTDGRINELIFAETLTFVCDGDSQLDSLPAGQETYAYTGELAQDDRLAWNWPLGSGASGSLTAVLASENSGTNLLSNSDFEDFDDTANQPDEWANVVGAAGTDYEKESTTVFAGSNCLQFTGDASTLAAIAQTFNSSSGTTSTLSPNTIYHFSARIRKNTTLTAGVIELSLVDGSNNYITNDLGNNCAQTIAHGSISDSSWTQWSGVFVTPDQLPSTYKIRLRQSTAISNTHEVYVDHLSLVAATELYTGGPYGSAHSGATNAVRNDKYTMAVGNDRAGALQEWFDRLFDMKSLGLQLPSDTGGAETIADTVIA